MGPGISSRQEGGVKGPSKEQKRTVRLFCSSVWEFFHRVKTKDWNSQSGSGAKCLIKKNTSRPKSLKM